MLKSISIISCIALMMSCQSEDTNTTEEEALVEGEVEVIDKAYVVDLESYKGVPVIFEDNSVHSIEEVLTDAALFSEYEIAHRHHLEINMDEDTKTLYVSGQDKESAEKMMTTINNEKEITSRSKALDDEGDLDEDEREENEEDDFDYTWYVDYTLILFDDDDQLGNEESINFTGIVDRDSEFLANEFYLNVSSGRINKANSYSTGSQVNFSELTTTAYAYSSEDGKNSRTLLGGHDVDANLEGTAVGIDNIESVGLLIRISN